MEECIELLALTQELLFRDEWQKAMQMFMVLIDKLSIVETQLGEQERQQFSQMVKELFAALEQKNVLLLADLLEYELHPFLLGVLGRKA